MNKSELINHLAEKSGLPQTQTEELLNLLMQTIIEILKRGGEISLTGFGIFSAKQRKARIGVNPRDPNKKIQIPAVVVPKFKAGKNFKEALKESGSQSVPETTEESKPVATPESTETTPPAETPQSDEVIESTT